MKYHLIYIYIFLNERTRLEAQFINLTNILAIASKLAILELFWDFLISQRSKKNKPQQKPPSFCYFYLLHLPITLIYFSPFFPSKSKFRRKRPWSLDQWWSCGDGNFPVHHRISCVQLWSCHLRITALHMLICSEFGPLITGVTGNSLPWNYSNSCTFCCKTTLYSFLNPIAAFPE